MIKHVIKHVHNNSYEWLLAVVFVTKLKYSNLSAAHLVVCTGPLNSAAEPTNPFLDTEYLMTELQFCFSAILME